MDIYRVELKPYTPDGEYFGPLTFHFSAPPSAADVLTEIDLYRKETPVELRPVELRPIMDAYISNCRLGVINYGVPLVGESGLTIGKPWRNEGSNMSPNGYMTVSRISVVENG